MLANIIGKMYSRGHALLSAVIGILLAAGASSLTTSMICLAYVLLLGVGIDFDHFAIGRINRGDWTNARRCLRDPVQIFTDQSTIFDSGDIGRDQRLLSHLLIGGVLTVGFWFVNEYWAFVTAVTVYTHVLADLYSDIWTRDEYLEKST